MIIETFLTKIVAVLLKKAAIGPLFGVIKGALDIYAGFP